jgi:phospholipid/cholesterol/gamma-HCH transport system ATP-binding protein
MDDAPQEDAPYFEVSNLRRGFGDHEVLRGVSFSVPRGLTTVILGGSGAGKSVLLKHLNGLLRPASGTVRVLGREIDPLSERELAPIRRRIGVLFQDGALFDSLDVGENVAFPLRERGERDESRIAARVAEVLGMVGLSGQERKMPDALSGGMRKRASLARALAPEPECLLCDEPTAGLDPILSESITKLLRRLQEELRLTSVIVTHNLGAMRYAADQVVFLRDGAVRYVGPVAGFESCPDEAVREFIAADAIGRG